MEVVGIVLPFKANNYVVEQLFDWNNIPNDPIFVLTFPHTGRLKPEHYDQMADALKNNVDKKETVSQSSTTSPILDQSTFPIQYILASHEA